MTVTANPNTLHAPLVLEPHQQQIHDFVASRPFAGAWVNVGGGKTLSTLSVLQTVRPIGHILVVAPVAIARSTWIDEIEKWGFPIRTKSLIVDSNDKKLPKKKRLERYQEVFTDPPTMYFVNQELLTRPALKRCKDCGGFGGNGRACLQCQTGLVDQMPVQSMPGSDGTPCDTIIWPFQTVIIDESQGFKSHASGRFQALRTVRPAITRLIELTGTPSPNGLHDLWSQIYLLDEGQALGRTITEFRTRWFIPKMVPGTTTPAKWMPKVTAEEEIYAAIRHLVMSAKNTSLVLPPVTVEDVNVTLPPDLLDAYKEFKRDLVLEIVNEAAQRQAEAAYDDWLRNSIEPEAEEIRRHLLTLTGDALAGAYARFRNERIGQFLRDPDLALVSTVVAENQAVLTSKLAQFASGTLYTADPDDPSTKGRYEIVHDKKLEMAEYLVRNNGGEPVLIAYHFRSDMEQIVARLAKVGVDVQVFDGSREMVRRWNARQIPVMLLHPASAGHGLNLQHGGSTMIWYTLPFSLEHYLQTNGRLHRPGQTRPVTIHRLITKDTQDERMPRVLADKEHTQDNLLAAVSGETPLLTALQDEIAEDLKGLWIADRV